MEETIITFCSTTTTTTTTTSTTTTTFPNLSHHHLTNPKPKPHHFRTLSSYTSISQISKPPKLPIISPLPSPTTDFSDKILFLDSIGIDFFDLIDRNPSIITSLSLRHIKATVNYMRSLGFTSLDFRRICGMCPEILTYTISDITPVFTFLLREANVKGCDLRRVIHRRPRLLVSSVEQRLRPTLYFLQSLGVTEVQNYTSLLSSSVEDKFVPRLDFLEKNMGFCYRDVVSMVRRFPQLFCYSIKHNFEPKFNYFVMDMGRDVKELKEFPQYFSFSLEKRIKPRHLSCVSKGVYLPLPVLLKTRETLFWRRLEMSSTAINSSSEAQATEAQANDGDEILQSTATGHYNRRAGGQCITVTNYILKIWDWIYVPIDSMVGDEMLRGISAQNDTKMSLKMSLL